MMLNVDAGLNQIMISESNGKLQYWLAAWMMFDTSILRKQQCFCNNSYEADKPVFSFPGAYNQHPAIAFFGSLGISLR